MKQRKATRTTQHETHTWCFRWLLRPSRCGVSCGFTLIELILVMAVLTIAVSITAPALANFFHGRTLDSEARLLLALTRQGQSRAVSEGIPMELWLDTARGTYGLETEPSYELNDSKALEFTLANEARLDVASQDTTGSGNARGGSTTGAAGGAGQVAGNHPNLPKIRFLPDGSISDSSPRSLRIVGRDGSTISLSQSRSRLSYEITNR